MLDDHADLADWLINNGFDSSQITSEAAWFVDEFDYVRCSSRPHLCYIELPAKITKNQLYSIEEWLEQKLANCQKIAIEAPNGIWSTYELNEYFPEDLFKIIKRYYSSGKLYENKGK